MNNAIDLPSLQSIELGYKSFGLSNTTIIESMLLIWNVMKWIDLPSLLIFTLGYFALCGYSDNDDDESCSLTMRSIHSMISNWNE